MTNDFNYKEHFELLAKYYYSLFEGNELYVDEALDILYIHGLIDDEGFWIEED